MLSFRLALKTRPVLQHRTFGHFLKLIENNPRIGYRYIHATAPTCRVNIITRTGDGRSDASEAEVGATEKGDTREDRHGLGYAQHRSAKSRRTTFQQRLHHITHEVDTEVRSRASSRYAVAREERLAQREAQLAEEGEFEELGQAVSDDGRVTGGEHAGSERAFSDYSHVPRKDEYESGDALARLRKEMPFVPAEVPIGKPEAPAAATTRTGEKIPVVMPRMGGVSLPNLDLSKLPWNPDEAASWILKFGKLVEPPLSAQMTLKTTLSLLSKRSPYDNVFRKSPSAVHLMNVLMKLERTTSLEANYISFLNALFRMTYQGKQRFVVDMLYHEQKLRGKKVFVKSKAHTELAAMFARIVEVLGVHKVFSLSDTGAACCLGVLHLLGGQRLWKDKDMSLHANRALRMHLDSAIVFAGALSQVPVWLQGKHHYTLLKTTLRHIDRNIGFHEKPVESEVSGEAKTDRNVRGAAFQHEHLLAYLEICARAMIYPRGDWKGLSAHLSSNLWALSHVEIGTLASSISFLCLPVDDRFLKSFALRIEDDTTFFPATSRIECIQFMLDKGKRCNASVVNLLREVHLVDDYFIKAHPYISAKLYDVLMMLWFTDRSRFEDNKHLRVVFIREHLLRCKEVMRGNYYTNADMLARSEDDLKGDSPPFQSLLLPILTPLKCTSPPSIPSSSISQQEESSIREAWDHAESVLYNCWVNGVYVSAAILCDADGALVPWHAVSHLLTPRPAWWRSKFKISHFDDGEIVGDEPLRLGDGDVDAFDDGLLQLEDDDDVLSLDGGGGGGDEKATQLDTAANAEMLHDGGAAQAAKERKRKRREALRKRYITLDKAKMEREGISLQPIALTVYEDEMALLRPRSSRVFNGFVATQSNILYQSGWASIAMLASELSPRRSIRERHAALYKQISQLVEIPHREDLIGSDSNEDMEP